MGRSAQNLVFVVGAGASKEFGLPTGKQLLEKISSAAEYQWPTQHTMSFVSPVANEVHELARRAVNSTDAIRRFQEKAVWLSKIALLAPSIDNVLHTHREDPEVVDLGKLMIAHSLIAAEKASSIANVVDRNDRQSIFHLATSSRGKTDYVSETWLGELFRFLVEMRNFDEFMDQLSKITFISFNYDRCIQQFLGWCSKIYFQLDDNDVKRVMDAPKIIHPYGSLGALSVNSGAVVGFGSPQTSLLDVALGIRTFTESIDEGAIRENLDDSFSNASAVFFLGFGFLDLNMRLLFSGKRYEVPTVYGTCLGISESSANLIRQKIEEYLLWGSKQQDILPLFETQGATNRIILESATCCELLQRHHFQLRA
jgi:hypothetical protein